MRFRFRLRTLLLVTLLLGPPAAWYGPPLVRCLQHWLTAEEPEAVPFRTHGGII